MILTVQLIVVEWTKQSRGAPGSTQRNAVPEVWPLTGHPSARLSVQQVRFVEYDGFQKPSVKWRSDPKEPQICELGLGFAERGQSLEIAFRNRYRASYDRPKNAERRQMKSIASLQKGSVAQIRTNARLTSIEGDWSYLKSVYNIAWTKETPHEDLFSRIEPVERFDDLVNLY